MDKGLEKINKLKDQLTNLYDKKDSVEDNIDFKNDELEEIDQRNEKLYSDLKHLNSEKRNIQYKLKNIKKWKLQTILKTTFYALLSLIFIAIMLFKQIGIVPTCIFSFFALSFTVFFGESGCYYYNRKYLKSNSLDDVEKEIEKTQKEIKLNNTKIVEVKLELKTLKHNLEELVNKITLLKSEIEDIQDIRYNIITEYLNNNKEVDSLLNTGYDKFVEEKSKQKTRKKDRK